MRTGLADDGSRRRNNVGFALQILQRRLASSPAAIHESLKRRSGAPGERGSTKKDTAAGGSTGRRPGDRVSPATTEPRPSMKTISMRRRARSWRRTRTASIDRATAAQTIAELEAEIAELRRLEAHGPHASPLRRGYQVA